MKKEKVCGSLIIVLNGHCNEKGVCFSDGFIVKTDDIVKELDNKRCGVLNCR
jgi:hypothetical protein